MDRLPTTDDGVKGLLSMAEKHGDAQMFQFLRWIRAVGSVHPSRAATDATALLAARIVGTSDQAAVGLDLGYPPNSRGNFYKLVAAGQRLVEPQALPMADRLPTAEEGAAGLLGMAQRYGDVELFHFLRWMRVPRTGSAQPTAATQASAILAARLVRRRMDADPGADWTTARHDVAIELGYRTDRARQTGTNFYDLVALGESLDNQN